MTPSEVQEWTNNLNQAKKNFNIGTFENQIVRVTDSVGQEPYNFLGWISDDVHSIFGGWAQPGDEKKWGAMIKNLDNQPVVKYATGVVKDIGQNSWDGLDAFQVPIPAVSFVLNSFSYAEDALAAIFRAVVTSFQDTAKFFGADGMASYTKYINDASQTMFKNRKFDDDDIRDIVKTWNTNHPDKKIIIHTPKNYLGFSVNEIETVSLAQIIVSMFYSLFEGLLILTLAKGLVAAYKKLTGNAKNAYRVGLTSIIRSRVAAFYRIKLTYLKYVNLVDQGESNMIKVYGKNNTQILNWNKKIHDKIDALAKKDIPKVWFDASLWYKLCNNEWYNCVLEQTIYQEWRKAKELDNNDPESPGKLYVGMQKQIYKMLDSVVDQVTDKQVQDAKTKKEKPVQTDKKDVQ